MPENNRDEEQESLEAPPRLLRALKGLPKSSFFVPRTVDEAILRAASRHLAPQTKGVFKRHFLIRWGFAALTLILLLSLIPQFLRKPGSIPIGNFARGDLNGDGKVDILDAFALARQIKSGAHLDLQLDVNGDGVVDERDVAALAARAVSLGKGGHS